MLPFLRPALLALLAVPLLASAATPEAATEHVQARLVSSQATVAPGQRFTVALEQNIKPHWHTYWVNPGDSGQATTIDWTGAQASPIQWPTPSVQAIGPIVNYGYEGRPALLVELTVPADAKPGGRFQPGAEVKWLVCKDVCIPEQVSLGLDLPVAAEGKAGPDAAQIDEWRRAIPKPAPFAVQLKPAAQGVQLSGPTAGVTKAYFFADTWGAVAHSAPQALKAEGSGWALDIPAGDEPVKPGQPLAGVVVLTTATGEQAWTVSAPMPQGAGKGPGAADLAAPAAAEPVAPPESDLGLLPALALALMGGLILNLMPCVFPVLSIKALALVREGNHKAEGLAYTAGVLASFAVLAAVLIALRAGGQQVGWGFQFHSPVFVLVVAYLLFLVGLSLSGLFEIGGSFTGVGSSLAAKQGLAGSFFTGVLAAVVATPCTAPFMGAALAFALSQPAAVLIAVFLALGLGLALPFLILAFWPAAQRWLPRPGAWMDRFKQALAFPMYAAVVWLLWVLAQQAGPDGVALALCGVVLIAFGLWWRNASGASAVGTLAAVASVVLALGVSAWIKPVVADVRAESSTEAFSAERLAELRAQNKPVFVNLTAAWCISCLVNERVALSRPEVHDAFAKAGVVYLKGDWTREDPKITAVLKAHGRSGVPLYLYYAPGATEAQVLPQILTPGLVVEAVSTPRPPEFDMTKLLRRSLIAAVIAAPVLVHTAAQAAANVDAPAPAFTATTADGKTVNLADYKGKTVVLEWTNHDCPYVKKHYGSGNIPTQQKAAAAQGVVWLQVISSAPGQQGFVDGATAQKLNADRGATPTATLLDPKGELGKLYGAQTTPHLYVIKGDGTLAYKGGIDSIATADKADIAKAEPYVTEALAAVAAGRKVEKASTRPYGCSVKYAS